MADHKKLGNAAFRDAQYPAAISHFSAALSALEDPLAAGAATLYSNRSAAYMLTGEAKLAAEDARSAISAKPSWSKGHYRLATALEALGETRGALTALQESLRLEPDNSEVAERCTAMTKQLASVRANGVAKAAVVASPRVGASRQGLEPAGRVAGRISLSPTLSPACGRVEGAWGTSWGYTDTSIPPQGATERPTTAPLRSCMLSGLLPSLPSPA